MSIGRRKFLRMGAATAATAVGGCSAPPMVCHGPARGAANSAFGGKIEHFVVLMMENRSYDQMLGSLTGPEHDGIADGTPIAYVDASGAERVSRVHHGAPPDRFSPDPGHSFVAVADQIRGRGSERPADMAGFVSRLLKDHPSASERDIEHYLTIYGQGHLPVLQRLATEYGVCSHWFCSLPGSTTPNRMFAHAGTSQGATRQGAYYSRVEDRMIFDKLEPERWCVYYHDVPHLFLTGDAWTQTFCGQFHHMKAFERAVEGDALPTYTFIEPQHVIPPWSSQHPSAGVSHGEKLIASVYNTLVSNPCVFEKSLLLIVYDEHGGFPDHVVPPGHDGWGAGYEGVQHLVVRPDERVADHDGPDKGYDFTTLGPRVPAVVVSPLIERGSVFGWKASDPMKRVTFDHTSILSTVAAMTGVWVDSDRARAATNLEVVINRGHPRTDYPRELAFDAGNYSGSGSGSVGEQGEACGGIASDLCDDYRARHGEATPEEVTAHFQRIIQR